MSTWLIILILIVLLILVVSRWLYFRMMFKPTQEKMWIPEYSYEELRISSNTGKLLLKKPNADYPSVHMWYFNNFRRGKTILFCHGNYGNITERKYVIRICQLLNINLLVFDYRGYGESTGIPTINGIKEDGLRVYEYLRSRGVASDKIIIWGESLGGIVAAWLAAQVECFRLVLFSTFSTLEETIRFSDMAGWLKVPLSLMVLNVLGDISNKRNIRKAKCPVIIVHSEVDNLIPYHCAIESLMSAKTGYIIPIKGRHDQPIMNKKQMKELFWRLEVKLSNRLVKRSVAILNESLKKTLDETSNV